MSYYGPPKFTKFFETHGLSIVQWSLLPNLLNVSGCSADESGITFQDGAQAKAIFIWLDWFEVDVLSIPVWRLHPSSADAALLVMIFQL